MPSLVMEEASECIAFSNFGNEIMLYIFYGVLGVVFGDLLKSAGIGFTF